MAKIYLIIIFLLINIKSISTKASNSLADCQAIAAKFNSTKNVTCYGLTDTSCPGIISGDECTFEHSVVANCINITTVQISIQSNGLPSFCPNPVNPNQLLENNITFIVNFNPDVSVKQPIYNSTKQAELDAVLCNINSTISSPGNFNLTLDINFNDTDSIVGISIDGVPIFNAVDIDSQDIFYPKTHQYNKSVDQCLGYTNTDGIYHYAIGSSCPLDPPIGQTTACNNIPTCNANIPNYSTSMFINHKNLTVIGIANDGHLIYGPYTSDGMLITQGFDICNGMFFDSIGNYGYFVTSTFPYIIGCFGPGNYPDYLLPTCTNNPPLHYIKSSYAQALSNVDNGSLMLTFNFIGITATILTLIKNYN